MFLGIILACMSLEDATTCIPIPNVVRFYESQDQCMTEAESFAFEIANELNLHTAAFCYEVQYFEEV